jgi:hypothetical protein
MIWEKEYWPENFVTKMSTKQRKKQAHMCTCTKPGPGYSKSYIVVVFCVE